MNWISVILLIGVVQGLFLALLLLHTPNGNRTANPWLAAYIAAFALVTVSDVMRESGLALDYPHFVPAFDTLLLLIGPFMLFYVRALIGVAIRPRAFLLHAIPALLVLLWILPFYTLSVDEMRALMAEDMAAEDDANPFVLAAVAQTFGYWLWAALLLRRHAAHLKINYSDIGRRSFSWLLMLLKINLILWGLWVLALMTGSTFAQTLSNLVLSVMIYAAGYFGLRQPQVFFELLPEEPIAADTAPPSVEKYAKSRIDPQRAEAIAAQLKQAMATNKPHLQNDLTLSDLACHLDVTAHQLSQVFSECISTSFFDYINTYRVEEVKHRLADPNEASTSILDIAFSAGFNSKAAFNAAFRKYVGTTPSVFRRTAQQVQI